MWGKERRLPIPLTFPNVLTKSAERAVDAVFLVIFFALLENDCGRRECIDV